MKFGLIGDGKIAKKHRYAIERVGELVKIYDPKYGSEPDSHFFNHLDDDFFNNLDYVVICSPSHLHREHIKLALSYGKKVIVEKPMILPWEPIIDNDDVSVVMQLRYAPIPVKSAEKVCITMVRDEAYFKTWKGEPRLTGGIFYNLFIHYIDLAISLNADFVGIIQSQGKQARKIDDFDLMKINMEKAYLEMYLDIMNGGGVKPRDLFYLHWILERCNYRFGMGKEIINRQIIVPRTMEI